MWCLLPSFALLLAPGDDALHIAFFVQFLDHAVDPAEAKAFFHQLLVGDAGLAGGFFEAAQPDFGLGGVVGFQPLPPFPAGFGVEDFGDLDGHGELGLVDGSNL